MKKIIAFGASTSTTSINKQLAAMVAKQITTAQVNVLDLNDFELPMYSSQEEEQNGIPANAKAFKQEILNADAIVVSVAEHNGNFTAAFKNLYDWVSRLDKRVFNDSPVFLLSTSPGKMGASSAFALAKNSFGRMGANIVAEFSLPSFYENFSENQITNPDLEAQLQNQINAFRGAF